MYLWKLSDNAFLIILFSMFKSWNVISHCREC